MAIALACASVALAESGKLTPKGCISDTAADPECAARADALDGPAGLAMSPDGKSLYVAAHEGDAIVHLRRNRRTGKLRDAGCIDDVGGPDPCAAHRDGLDGIADVAISEDGRHVYSASLFDATLLHFRRNVTTGKLTFAHCIDDAGMAPVDNVCEPSTDGLNYASNIALGPEGRSLYVTGAIDDALVRFSLSRRGKPRARGCIEDDDKTFQQGECSVESEGLQFPSGIAIRPNGRALYVPAFGDDALTRFKRNPRTGAIAFAECVRDRNTVPADGDPDDCARRAEALDDAGSVGISPDGRYLYAGTVNISSFSIFRLQGRKGALRSRGCVEGPFSSNTCGTVSNGIGRSSDFAFDRRGRSMYVAGGPSVGIFKRYPRTGLVDERPCIDDDDRPPSATVCTREGTGILGTGALELSADDRYLYTAAATDDAVGILRRAR